MTGTSASLGRLQPDVSLVLSREASNYRKVAQEHWGLTDEQMIGMHVHHEPPRSRGGRNIPEHLYVCSVSVHYLGWHKGTRGNHLDCFENVPPEVLVANGKRVGTLYGRIGGSKSRPSEEGRKALQRSGYNQGKRNSKPIVVTHIQSGESFVFPSASTAARFLGLSQGNLSKAARDGGKTRGFSAVYLPLTTV
jgi:hypothetical protein